MTLAVPAAGITPQELRNAFGPGMRRGLVIGDSISRAGGVPDMQAHDAFTFKFFEAGIFTIAMARRFEKAVNLPKYTEAVTQLNILDPWDFTLILLGTNDYGSSIPLPDVKAAYSKFLQDVQAHDSYRYLRKSYQTLICVTPLRRARGELKNRAGYTLSDMRKAIGDLCRGLGIPVIDGLSLIPEDPEIGRSNESTYFFNGLHPNQQGHDIMADRLLRQIVDHFAQHPTWYDRVWLKRRKAPGGHPGTPPASAPTPTD